MLRRLRSDRGEVTFVKVFLFLVVAGIAYVAYARGPLWLEHQALKSHVRAGMNRSYARRNTEVVKETILAGVVEEKMQNEDLAVDGSIIRRPLELTDENLKIEITAAPPTVHVWLEYERTFAWPFTKKIGRSRYTYDHTEDLSAVKY